MLLLLAAAQPPQPAAPAQAEIVVRARTEQELRRFVQALTQTRGQRQIARWNDRICPRVLGLDAGHAAYVVGRIGAIARGLRIPVGSGRCAGNVVIVVPSDADEFTRMLVDRYPRLFRGPRDNLATRAEIASLLEPRPVRWIAPSATGNADGGPIMDGINQASFSRLRMATRENARLSFIIVDAGRLANITWGQLADYLSVVALGRPDMAADHDDATVLSIFQLRDRGSRGPRRLTAQDRALLRALYATNAAQSAAAQRSDIRTHMARDDGAPETD